jgi:hypothetical protein
VILKNHYIYIYIKKTSFCRVLGLYVANYCTLYLTKVVGKTKASQMHNTIEQCKYEQTMTLHFKFKNWEIHVFHAQ